MIQVFAINFRNRQTVPAKMPGKLQKRNVFFAHVIQNSNRGDAFRWPDE